jgi:PAS domain S-box-containing protein
MKNTPEQIAHILDRHISGYHRYILTDPVHLCDVSTNLCEMVGYSRDELLQGSGDAYAALVHPADREAYAGFLRQLRAADQTLTAEYRLVRRDGAVLFVRDTAVSESLADGSRVLDSVLADITALKRENENLHFLNETVPCCFLKYTCEKQPKVTFINQQMRQLLRFPEPQEGELDYFSLCRNNIFLMIPMEERRRFARYLDRVYAAGIPLAGEMSLLRCDGTRVHVFGWVTKSVNEQGVEEFQSACVDVTSRYRAKRAAEARRYLKALTDVYDKVFEYDFTAGTVKCLHTEPSSAFKQVENVPMQMEEATEKWIADTVSDTDRDKVHFFVQAFFRKKLRNDSDRPPQITYRARSSDGEVRLYSGIFLNISPSVSLYCCRRVPDWQEADRLRLENVSLKENMQELVTHFTDGIAAFKVTHDGLVTPLYASDNACEFFGMSKETWLALMEKSTPLETFVANSEAAYGEFMKLLRNGEAEFTYFDLKSETERRIKAICSQKTRASSPRYVMLYNVETARKAAPEPRSVTIRTFGYFDVFVGKTPIAFRNKKSKELFALLVDRRGGYVSSEEAISFLWEDEPASPVTFARYRKVALRLKNILEEYGISDVVEAVDGKRRIVPEKVRCDLYDYLTGKEEYAHLFKGSYLSNYGWGETTLAELVGDHF